jgi:peptidoglycan hydrolase-like protein with peptidoglycan-binding domain
MTWRVAKSILVLRSEVDAVAPRRNKASDGTIGDAAHATRSSDHNPYIKDSRGVGVVRAVDVTHDPAGGLDANRLAEHARVLGAKGDKRLRYVIWNRRIASGTGGWAWRAYSGSNPHTKHVHISVSESASGYDSGASWRFSKSVPGATWIQRDRLPLQKGHKDGKKRLVSKVQRQLGGEASGRFSSGTEKAVKRWQSLHDGDGRRVARSRGLVVDGVVGPKTWRAMFRGSVQGTESKDGETAQSPDVLTTPRPRERMKLPALVAEFVRLQKKTERAWETVVLQGGRRRQSLAEARASSLGELSAILLRIEDKLEALVELGRSDTTSAEAQLVAASLKSDAGQGGSMETGGKVGSDESSKSDPSAVPNPTGNGAGQGPTSTVARGALKDLSDNQLVKEIEELETALGQSRAVLIRRYLNADRELTPSTRDAVKPRRSRRGSDERKTSGAKRAPSAKRRRRVEPSDHTPQPRVDPDEVSGLQRSLNRFTDRFLKGLGPILVDGDRGPVTRKRIVLAKYHLGYRGQEQRSADVTPEFLRHLRSPRTVRPGMLARASGRRRKQRRNARRASASRAGVADFDGRPVASWMVPHLRWAREQGWKGTVISGYREPADSEDICRQQCGAPSCPGTCAGRASNHSGKVQPTGALDLSEHVRFAELMRSCPHSPRIFNALGPADPNHFSATGR